MTPNAHAQNRRRFLRLLAGSPLVAGLTLPSNWVSAALAQTAEDGLIASAKDAINVFDFERVAQKNIPIGHFSYLCGVEDEGTLRANREGFSHYQLRVRRLVDISKVDTSVTLFGKKWETPIVVCPIGSTGAFHSEGEVGVARGAKAGRFVQTISTVASRPIEDVAKAKGEPVWFQLYRDADWNQTLGMIKRAEAAGSSVMAWTIDNFGGRKMEVQERGRRTDTRNCGACHKPGQQKPMRTTKAVGPPLIDAGSPTWDYVKRLKDATSMKLVLKGIVTREDAERSIEYGADGVWVSNHGGRAENSLLSTVDCIADVAAGVAGRGVIIADSGFRRGTDIFKALALGATAVGVGRPYIWGLGAFGHEGVEAVLEILSSELQMVMRQAGTRSLREITGSFVSRA
jgi:isopentenyl diphosphate isomerase/L-lactate dehydrogenase-like FMN-dependent dehydrogenase